MIRLLLVAVAILVFTNLLAQNNNGINFISESNWDEVKVRAKKENKYIFIDCFTTWCGPCKKMDKEVYANDSVGNYFNKNFIALKIQMDSTKNDSKEIQAWHPFAESLQKTYEIKSFPTFLFFSPDGIIVHRAIAYYPVKSFIKLSKDALDTNYQVYTLLGKYNSGRLEPNKYLFLADNISRKLDDQELSKKIGHDYLINYLYKQSAQEIISRENLDVIARYIKSSNEKGFKIIYNNPRLVDSVYSRNDFSQLIIDRVITDEIIKPAIDKAQMNKFEPNWSFLYGKIVKKFNAKVAFRCINNSKFNWAVDKQDFTTAMDLYIERIDKLGINPSFSSYAALNNIVYNLFFYHAQNNKQIEKPIKWMESILRDSVPGKQIIMDTYANLLYKVGQVKEAIYWEEKALDLEKVDAINSGRSIDKSYEEVLEKMRLRQPTWIKQD
jgi:thioredoxin-related protein